MAEFDSPKDSIMAGQHLSSGEEMFSSGSATDQSEGILHLNMEKDWSHVPYPVNNPDTPPYANWATTTYGRGDSVVLYLDNDRYFYPIEHHRS